jgi:hypothetical protein
MPLTLGRRVADERRLGKPTLMRGICAGKTHGETTVLDVAGPEEANHRQESRSAFEATRPGPRSIGARCGSVRGQQLELCHLIEDLVRRREGRRAAAHLSSWAGRREDRETAPGAPQGTGAPVIAAGERTCPTPSGLCTGQRCARRAARFKLTHYQQRTLSHRAARHDQGADGGGVREGRMAEEPAAASGP